MLMMPILMSACFVAAPDRPYEPTSAFTDQQIEGFTIRVSNRLVMENPDLAAETLKLLGVKLYDITRVVPDKPLADLREVPIWVEIEDVNGRHACMCYHPSREWLTEHGYNPDKAGSVEVANAANFLTWMRDQPFMVLHELAHAYHHQVLGYDNADVRQAYEHAKEAGIYESVLRCNGQMDRAYALNNDQEYFAELTEAYFGANDFYPFVRAEVREHDPEGFAMLQQAWERSEPE